MAKQTIKEPSSLTKAAIAITYVIDNYDDGRIKLDNYQQLVDVLIDEYPYEGFNRKNVSKAIQRFNKGVYRVDGVTVDDLGKIYFVGSNKLAEDKTAHVEGGSGEEVLDLDEITKQVKGGKVRTGWFTLPTGEKVMVSPDGGADIDEAVEAEKEIKKLLTEEYWDLKYEHKDLKEGREGVVFITDLHIGALVQDLLKTPEYNKEVVKEKMLKAVQHINNLGFDKVHVMCLGDIIESYTGTNHKNTWKGLEIGGHGPTVVKTATRMLHEFFLSQIDNLERICMIAGNHCRTTPSAEEETEGGVSNLVAWGLELIGYNVKFDVKCLSEDVEGIQYIMLHGDKGISKRPTKDIIWDFGQQGKFNFVAEGHLHSRIQRLSANARDKLQMVKDDSIDCRRQVMPSFFTGNGYSEDNLWFSTSGFVICCNNGEGKPIVIDIPL